jgi:hypothetical protein
MNDTGGYYRNIPLSTKRQSVDVEESEETEARQPLRQIIELCI